MHKTSIVCNPERVGKDLQYQEMLLLIFWSKLIIGTSTYFNVIDCLDITIPTIYKYSMSIGRICSTMIEIMIIFYP